MILDYIVSIWPMQKQLPSWAVSQNNQRDYYEENSSSEDEEEVTKAEGKNVEQEEKEGQKAKSDDRKEESEKLKKSETEEQINIQEEAMTKLLQTESIAIRISKWKPQAEYTAPFFVPQQKFDSQEVKMVTIFYQIINKSKSKEFEAKLNKILQDISWRRTTIQQALSRLNVQELETILSHRIMLDCLQKKVDLLIHKVNRYLTYAFCNFNEIIYVAYRQQPQKIDFELLEKTIYKVMKKGYKESFDKIALDFFVETWVKQVRKDYRFRWYELKRNWLKEGKVMREDQDSEQEEQSTEYDKQSTFGIFTSKEQEQALNSDGIYNYRMHRTLQFMKKQKIVDGSVYPEMSKDYATFLIKLTDLHMEHILKKAVHNCKLSLQNKVTKKYKGVMDEFSYFSKKNYPQDDDSIAFDLSLSKQEEHKVTRCTYPYSILAHYSQLRYQEVLRQNKVYELMYPEICITLGCTKGKNTLYQDLIDNYFKTGEHSKDTVKEYLPPRAFDPPKTNRVIVQIEHLRAALEEEKCYQDSELLQRLRFEY